jgi:hypothetical protein
VGRSASSFNGEWLLQQLRSTVPNCYSLFFASSSNPPSTPTGGVTLHSLRVVNPRVQNLLRVPSDRMASPRLRAVALGVGLVRVAAGLSLGGTPATFLRWERDVPSGTSMPLLLRTVGIRDLALGLGTASAVHSGSTRDLHRWLGAGLVSDALDVVAGIRSARTIGARGVVSALIAAPMVLADAWALSSRG